MKYELDYSRLRGGLWLSSALSLLILLYIVRILSFANVEYYSTIYRFVDIYSFTGSITGSFFVDSILVLAIALLVIGLIVPTRIYAAYAPAVVTALVIAGFYSRSVIEIASVLTIPSVAVLLFLYRDRVFGTRLKLHIVAVTTLILIIGFEAVALLRWLSYPIFPSPIYGDWSWKVAELESQIFHSFGLFSPMIMLLILTAFLYKPSLKNITSWGKRVRLWPATKADEYEYDSRHDNENIHEKSRIWKSHNWILASAFGLSVILVIFAHIPTISQDLTAVDEHYYLDWLETLQKSDNLAIAFTEVAGGSRPLSLLFIYGIQSLTGLPMVVVVRFLPLILGPMLITVVYYFVKVGTGRKNLASLSALFTVVSFHFMVGMYAGFFANWLALVTTYLSLLFLISAWKNGGKETYKKNQYYYAAFLSTTLLTLFIHVYTWIYLMAAAILFIAISYAKNRQQKQKVKIAVMLGIIIAANVGVDIARTYWGGPSGLESDILIAQRLTGEEDFFSRWDNLRFTFNMFVGGHFTNAVMLFLALLWVLRAKFNNTFDTVLLSSIFVGILPVLFGDHMMQTRILYNMPLQIPAAIMLYRLTNFERRGSRLGSLLFIAIMVHLLIYAFRSMANLNLVT